MKKIILSLITAVILTACGNDPEDNTKVYSTFATLDAVAPQGCSLTVISPEDGSSYNMSAIQSINSNLFTAGTRVYITYSTPNNVGYYNGACTLYSMTNTEGGGQPVKSATAAETDQWASAELNLNALARTGKFINVVATAPINSSNYQLEMYLDSETAYDDYPQLHLVLVNNGASLQNLTMVGSWSIAEILDSPTCKGIKVFFNDPNSGSFTIDKTY